MKTIFLGAAFGCGGADIGSQKGPLVMRRHGVLFRHIVSERNHQLQRWPGIASSALSSGDSLARYSQRLRTGGYRPILIGGDHSAAIGFWSGISRAKRKPVGLIWIDAHLDSHTPLTSWSHRLHGMPLAILLGHADPRWQRVAGTVPPLRADAVTLIGIRSFEPEERQLLDSLGVRIITMDEVRNRGWSEVWREALLRARRAAGGWGISVDLDGLSPRTAPGVSVPVADGINSQDLGKTLRHHRKDPRLLAIEFAEFNPRRDKRAMTLKLLLKLLCLPLRTYPRR